MAKYKIIPSSRTIAQSPISIGHKAEKGVEAIEFDLTAWVETYGSGTATIIMKRWGDDVPYPVALEISEDNKATWTLSDTDTAKAGMAYAQLSYIVGETVVKKSDIYTFRVMDSLTGEGEPPEAYESWLEHLTHIAAEAMAEVLDIEGIVTDKTLTVDGGIADAKATGEALAEKVDAADYSELSARVGANTIALAEKADRSTTYTKTEVDALIESVDVETDTTLSVSGKPADAKTVGDELGAINESLGTVQADLTNIRTDVQDIEGNTQIEKTVSGSGCAVVLHETTSAPLSISLTGADANTTVTACGRNIYKLERNAYLMNGVAFTYDKTTGKIHIEGAATATTFSTPDEQLVNGTRYSCNAKWKFSQRTAVTLSPNFSQFLNYDSKIFMSVITADGVFAVRNAGGTFIVDAGDEIAFRIQVRSGWSGNIDCYPQVEINTHPSAFEMFKGYTSQNHAGSSNIFQLPSRSKWSTKGVTAVFDHDTNSLILSGTATSDALIVDGSGTIDGSSWNHIFKFTPSVDTIVHFAGVPPKYNGLVYAQIGYNGATYAETGNGFTLANATAEHEIGYRLLVKAGTTLDRYVITPVVSTGLCALQSQNGITTVYTNDGSTVSVSAQSNTSLQMLERTNNISKNLNILTAFNILHPLSRIKGRPPVISFIDDDTSSKADVERYAAVFDAKGVVGNYAVMPYSIETRTSENLDAVLLDLEKRGYGMLYHCYHQNGSNPDSPGAFYLEAYRNMVLAEDDFMTGLRKFLQYGFTNGNFWVAPYGVNDLQIQALAKRHGMRCLISMSNDRYISPSSGFNRWNIPRISVSPASNVLHYQNTVDACVADGGWLVVCTHANSWGSGTTMDTKVGDAIQYALDAGMVVKSFPEAFEDYMAVFDLYDLM